MALDITVHLIRHEKTKANTERKYIGRTDEPILKKWKPRSIYSQVSFMGAI